MKANIEPNLELSKRMINQKLGEPPETKIMNDLSWLVRSPSLISGADLAPVMCDELCVPEVEPTLLAKPRTYKLGIYAETLLEAAIHETPALKLLGCNIDIYRQKVAMGEFDFLVRRQSDQTVEHWELAVKFYCLSSETTHHQTPQPKDFWGPECRDTLEMKMNKVKGRQLLLSQTPEGKDVLKRMGILGPVLARLYSRGRFYYYFRIFNQALQLEVAPQSLFQMGFVSRDALSGWWCREKEFSRCLETLGGLRFSATRRLDWMTGPSEFLIRRDEAGGFLKDHFRNSEDTVMLWSDAGVSGFVVRDSWGGLS